MGTWVVLLPVITGNSLPIRLGLLFRIGYDDMAWLASSATHPHEASIAVEDQDLADTQISSDTLPDLVWMRPGHAYHDVCSALNAGGLHTESAMQEITSYPCPSL